MIRCFLCVLQVMWSSSLGILIESSNKQGSNAVKIVIRPRRKNVKWKSKGKPSPLLQLQANIEVPIEGPYHISPSGEAIQ